MNDTNPNNLTDIVIRRRKQWLDLIQGLSCSQGFYSRLWANICAVGKDSAEVQDWLSQFDDCTDDIDFIMHLEG